jgi:hypothetical protein
MDYTHLYNQLITDFELTDLPEEEKKEMLLHISKTIQKQFLLDIYDLLGKENFDALQASANMGGEFYATTLKHLAPNYEEIFQNSRIKVVTAFKNSSTKE